MPDVDLALRDGAAFVTFNRPAQRNALPDRIFVSGLRRALAPGFEELMVQLTDALRQGDYEAVCRLVRSGFAKAEDAALHDRRMPAKRNIA